jgi:hypothetical protein
MVKRLVAPAAGDPEGEVVRFVPAPRTDLPVGQARPCLQVLRRPAVPQIVDLEAIGGLPDPSAPGPVEPVLTTQVEAPLSPRE